MTREQDFKFDLTETFPHLHGAPIVEAIIHWQARSEKTLQPEKFREQLVKRLPDYPDCRKQLALQMEATINVDGSSTQINRDSWQGFRMTSSDQQYVAQFNRDGLVFSRLQPYNDWSSFVAEGRRLWEIFFELTGPSEIQRLGVRFINLISPIEQSQIGDYLVSEPKHFGDLGLPQTGFLFQSTYTVPDHSLEINVVQAIQPPTPPQARIFGLILDTDVFTTQPFPCNDDNIQNYLAKMRWLKNKIFFSQLKAGAIPLFKGAEK